MAVYTKVDEITLKSFISQYDIGNLDGYHGITEGVENTNYYLATEKGGYILTLYEKRTNEADLPFFMSLMQHLAKVMNVPQPIAQKNGAYLGFLAGRPCALTTFLKGRPVKTAQLEHCEAVGLALAQMHKAGKDFAQRRANALSLKAWRPLWEAAAPYSKALALSAEEPVNSVIESELSFLERFWPADLPLGIIHADLFMDNVFFENKSITGIIDFYFSCYDMLSYDLAITLNAWCFDEEFCYNPAYGAALLKAYHQLRPLTDEEQKFFPILARGAALRFFLTRFYDWFYTKEDSLVEKKHPLEYWKKLRFFQQIDSLQQLGFC